MEELPANNPTKRRFIERIIILILLILLLICLLCCCHHRQQATSVTDKKISAPTEQPKKQIELILVPKEPQSNTPIELTNAVPGDSVEKYFALRVDHDQDVLLHTSFSSTSEDEKEPLSDVLKVKIRQGNNVVLFDDSFKKLQDEPLSLLLKENKSHQTFTMISVTAYIPTWAGNIYQGKQFKGNILWSIGATNE